MEGCSRGSRHKGGRGIGSMGGSVELQHQDYAKRAFFGGSVCKEVISGGYLDPANDLSFPLTESSPTFLNASSQALSDFDFSELTGIVCLNQSMASNESCLEPSLNVSVPGVLHHVDIPMQLILVQVCRRLNLKLYGMGLVIESTEVFCGWIDMSVPLYKQDGMIERKKFYGHGCCTKYAAMEAVCTAVLAELSEDYDVIIKDFTYPRLKSMEASFGREIQWSSMMEDSVRKERGKAEYLRKQFRNLSAGILMICNEFSDILPIVVPNNAETAVAMNGPNVFYAGQNPPMTRVEKLAFSLVNMMANNGI